MNEVIEGRVASLSEKGDLITDIQVEQFADAGQLAELRVRVGPHETLGLHPPDHGEPESTMIAVLGSGGFVEIGIVGMNMGDMLGIAAGDKVTIES
ncbi:MAG: SAM hydroxide adenosyltransferase [Pirellulaceae bacterium]